MQIDGWPRNQQEREGTREGWVRPSVKLPSSPQWAHFRYFMDYAVFIKCRFSLDRLHALLCWRKAASRRNRSSHVDFLALRGYPCLRLKTDWQPLDTEFTSKQGISLKSLRSNVARNSYHRVWQGQFIHIHPSAHRRILPADYSRGERCQS